jgi:hypothetical protein
MTKTKPRSSLALIAAVLAGACLLFVPSRAEARGCTERSDIVGQQRCSRFGDFWSVESQSVPMLFRFGARYDELSTANTTFVEDTRGSAYRYRGEALGVKSLTGVGVDGGVAYFLWKQMYLGVEGSVSLGSARIATFTTASGVTLSGDTGANINILHVGFPFGYRIPLGRASIRGELCTGLASITVHHQTTSATEGRGLIEPRLAGDIWFTHHLSFGVYGGVNVLDADARSRSFGVSVTWYTLAFGDDTRMK